MSALTNSSVIHPEVDWDRTFAGPLSAHGKISTLRRDPRQNSTTTIHLADDWGRTTSLGRPTAGQRTYFMGPSQRVVGGQLRWVYPENTPRAKMGRTMDPAEILAEADRTHGATGTGTSGTAASHTSTPGAQRGRSHSSGAGAGHGDVAAPSDAFARAAEWSAARRGVATAALGTTRRDYRTQHSGVRPLVYWEGATQTQHVVDPAPGHEGPSGLKEDQLGWSLQRTGGLRDQPTSGATVAQPGHLGTQSINPLGTTSQQMYGLSPSALAHQSLADSVRTYGSVFKPIGHKEYEHVAKNMNGLNSWDNTQSHLTSSMRVGHPSTLMGPWEHTVTRLTSLRRPSTSSVASRAQW